MAGNQCRMNRQRRSSHSDEDISFSDEFEEFHVRSFSGGHLPYDRQKLKERIWQRQNQEEAELIEQNVILARGLSSLKLDGKSNHDGTKSTKRPLEPKSSLNRVCCLSPVSDSADFSIGDPRPRVYSCPTQKNRFRTRGATQGDGISLPPQRVRSFTLTSKGLINRGDFFRPGLNSRQASTSGESSKNTSMGDLHDFYHIAFNGDRGVGKTSIINLFVKYLPAKDVPGKCSVSGIAVYMGNFCM